MEPNSFNWELDLLSTAETIIDEEYGWLSVAASILARYLTACSTLSRLCAKPAMHNTPERIRDRINLRIVLPLPRVSGEMTLEIEISHFVENDTF